MKKSLLLSLLLIFVVSSCFVGNFYPLYTPDTLVEMPGLESEWTYNDVRWEFEFNDSTLKYELTVYSSWLEPLNMSDEEYEIAKADSMPIDTTVQFKEIFEVGIVKLNGDYFMDMYPKSPNEYLDYTSSSVWWNSHIIPVHTISKIIVTEDSLNVCFLSVDWIGEQLETEDNSERNPDFSSLKVMVLEKDRAILAASTEQLQAFCSKYHADSTIFPNQEKTWARVRSEESK